MGDVTETKQCAKHYSVTAVSNVYLIELVTFGLYDVIRNTYRLVIRDIYRLSLICTTQHPRRI